MDTQANILIIDDEVGMREGCRRALTPHGFHVITAEHGAEGLRRLREAPVDLVLLDAMMPGMSGLELLDRIREHDPDILCVMITGYATVDLAAQATKHGAHDFLPKPFTSEELLSAVQRGLAERRRRLAQRRQRQHKEEQLQLERTRQEQAKFDAVESRFMLVIAHKLRDPAGVIKNYVQLMRAGYVDEEEWDEYLEKLDLRAGQLLDMLDDLLELAQLKSSSHAAKPKQVPLADVVQEVVRQYRPRAEAKGLDIEVCLEAQPSLLGQPASVRALWANLVENAIDYTAEGTVTVTLWENEGWVVGRVADTGMGVSTEDLPYIFQEFYRSEAAKARKELGTGLGLPIVNQIVENHGGAIEVESQPAGGTAFVFRLPSPDSGA